MRRGTERALISLFIWKNATAVELCLFDGLDAPESQKIHVQECTGSVWHVYDPAILELREREKRNFMLTSLLSQGVPMIWAGDEIGRTQRGNNNAYCQDSSISWLDWKLDDRKRVLLEFTASLIALRKLHPNLHRRKYFQDCQISPSTSPKQQVDGREVQDLCLYRPDGQPMTEDEWKPPGFAVSVYG